MRGYVKSRSSRVMNVCSVYMSIRVEVNFGRLDGSSIVLAKIAIFGRLYIYRRIRACIGRERCCGSEK